MAWTQRCLLLCYLVVCLRLSSVVADINYGDCANSVRHATAPRSDLIRMYLAEVQDMADKVADRLGRLNGYLSMEPIPSIKTQSTILNTTFWTYNMFVDGRVQDLSSTPRDKRAGVLWALHQILGRTYCLRDNLASALSRPTNYDAGAQTIAPNINFQCSSQWFSPATRNPLNRETPTYTDERTQPHGGGPLLKEEVKTRHEVPNGRTLFSVPNPPTGQVKQHEGIMILNNLRQPFPSVISINPQMFVNWTAIDNPVLKATLLKDRIQRGEDTLYGMRKNGDLAPEKWHIAELINYHASADLLVALGETRTMANFAFGPLNPEISVAEKQRIERERNSRAKIEDSMDKWGWPIIRNGEYMLRGNGAGCTIKGERFGPNDFECVVEFAAQMRDTRADDWDKVDRIKPACNSGSTYKYLMIALYLDKYDWSTGYNRPVSDEQPLTPLDPNPVDPGFEEMSFDGQSNDGQLIPYQAQKQSSGPYQAYHINTPIMNKIGSKLLDLSKGTLQAGKAGFKEGGRGVSQHAPQTNGLRDALRQGIQSGAGHVTYELKSTADKYAKKGAKTIADELNKHKHKVADEFNKHKHKVAQVANTAHQIAGSAVAGGSAVGNAVGKTVGTAFGNAMGSPAGQAVGITLRKGWGRFNNMLPKGKNNNNDNS